ncbi:MAG: MerR family DNA-binding transcriptional regulator [Planctomycetota bacterium]|nr:MerR family DNA-binding transcriptional regulator [Planctomycetota bacterium]
MLTSREVDRLLRYPVGRTARLARQGLLPHIVLPDGSIRFTADHVEQIVGGKCTAAPEGRP